MQFEHVKETHAELALLHTQVFLKRDMVSARTSCLAQRKSQRQPARSMPVCWVGLLTLVSSPLSPAVLAHNDTMSLCPYGVPQPALRWDVSLYFGHLLGRVTSSTVVGQSSPVSSQESKMRWARVLAKAHLFKQRHAGPAHHSLSLWPSPILDANGRRNGPVEPDESLWDKLLNLLFIGPGLVRRPKRHLSP